MNFQIWFEKSHSDIPAKSAGVVLTLASEGSTIPFIARYRKERTGNLDEVQIQAVITANETWELIQKRKKFILKEIESQSKLTPELQSKIDGCYDLDLLEDLYLPYKKKKLTKAQKAREAGLEPLANWIWDCSKGLVDSDSVTLEKYAEKFLNKELNLAGALQGAQDIIIEKISENLDLREIVRKEFFKNAFLVSSKGKDFKDKSKFENYFSHRENVQSLMLKESSHRYLAIQRGCSEKELSQKFDIHEDIESSLLRRFLILASADKNSPGKSVLAIAAELSFKNYVRPAIEAEIQKKLKASADEAAIEVFSENVRRLLLAPPLGAKSVIGVDPGIRTGCKVAVIGETGKYLVNFVLMINDRKNEKSREHTALLLGEVIKNTSVKAIAVGNGTAGRETEQYLREVIKEKFPDVPVVMVNESGASIYSASAVAREEFPDLDLTVRGAISIARRLQDPLAELVKLDPKSIGVGQYQHDVSQTHLKKSLELTVDSCVNAVGVDLNTSSEHLLAHVSGIGPALAKNIVKFRKDKGLFKNRKQLLNVSRFTEKAFQQSAGFLRIVDGDHPLDNTGVHPEQYAVLEEFSKFSHKQIKDLLGSGVRLLKDTTELREKIGQFTFDDIVKELEKPGRDPRDSFTPFHFREDVREVEDLKKDMICPGIVTNVTNFGAFVDIGVHQDGLVHISEIADRFVKDPREVVNPGDQVKVRVIGLEADKKRISLSLKRNQKSEKKSSPHTPAIRDRPARKLPKVSAKPGGKGPQIPQPLKQPRPYGRPKDRSKSRPKDRIDKKLVHNPFGALADLKNKLKKN